MTSQPAPTAARDTWTSVSHPVPVAALGVWTTPTATTGKVTANSAAVLGERRHRVSTVVTATACVVTTTPMTTYAVVGAAWGNWSIR